MIRKTLAAATIVAAAALLGAGVASADDFSHNNPNLSPNSLSGPSAGPTGTGVDQNGVPMTTGGLGIPNPFAPGNLCPLPGPIDPSGTIHAF